jgi:hypothetical protein
MLAVEVAEQSLDEIPPIGVGGYDETYEPGWAFYPRLYFACWCVP